MKPAELYILNQPQQYQEIIYYVCDVIEQEFLEVEMLFKWKIPFYYIGKKPFCYINASHKKKFVDIAFFYGNQLTSHPLTTHFLSFQIFIYKDIYKIIDKKIEPKNNLLLDLIKSEL